MYVNGALIGSSTAMSGTLTSKTFSYIASTAGSFEFFRGNIYNTFFYNRALSTQEVLGTYQAMFPRFLGQNIVMSNLVGYWNAGYRTSYPGSGNSWFDVSGYGNTGTLTNGPTYSAATGGSIVFDGSDDYVPITGVSVTSATFDFWFTPVNKGSGFGYVMSYGTNTPGQMVSISIANQSLAGFLTNGEIYCFIGGEDSSLRPSGFIVRFGAVYNVVITVSNLSTSIGMYINGVNYPITNSTPISLGSTIFNIGRWFVPVSGSNYLRGNINSGKVYNRALSASEVLQNYQATLPQILGQNIVTSGMIGYWDAGYVTSYGGTGTTWTNVSGVAGATGTLINGPTYATANGGAIVFDGSDDYCTLSSAILPPTSDWTYSSFFEISALSVGGVLYSQYIAALNNGRIIIRLADDVNNMYNLSLFLGSGSNYSSLNINSTVLPSLNTVYNFTVSRNNQTYSLYINGVLNTAYTTPFTANLLQTTPLIGGRTNSAVSSTPAQTDFLNGRIYNTQIYNRALSVQEVLQNYNAQKSRFGL